MDLGVTPMKYYQSHFLQNAKKTKEQIIQYNNLSAQEMRLDVGRVAWDIGFCENWILNVLDYMVINTVSCAMWNDRIHQMQNKLVQSL